VVVAVGLTETAVPLVTLMLPGVSTPLPPVNIAVRLELPPEVMIAGLAVKLVMASGLMVTVVVAVTVVPPLPVTVRV
jgi:hypothetical protein